MCSLWSCFCFNEAICNLWAEKRGKESHILDGVDQSNLFPHCVLYMCRNKMRPLPIHRQTKEHCILPSFFWSRWFKQASYSALTAGLLQIIDLITSFTCSYEFVLVMMGCLEKMMLVPGKDKYLVRMHISKRAWKPLSSLFFAIYLCFLFSY